MSGLPYQHLYAFNDYLGGRPYPLDNRFPFWRTPEFTWEAWGALANKLAKNEYNRDYQAVIKYLNCRYGGETLDVLAELHEINNRNLFKLFRSYPAAFFDSKELTKHTRVSSLVDELILFLRIECLPSKWDIQGLCALALQMEQLEKMLLRVIDDARLHLRAGVKCPIVAETRVEVRRVIGDKIWDPARRQVYGLVDYGYQEQARYS